MAGQWRGWIMFQVGTGDRRAELEAMGIAVGRLDESKQIYRDCVVDQAAYVRLLRKKGRFLWKLQREGTGRVQKNRPSP